MPRILASLLCCTALAFVAAASSAGAPAGQDPPAKEAYEKALETIDAALQEDFARLERLSKRIGELERSDASPEARALGDRYFARLEGTFAELANGLAAIVPPRDISVAHGLMLEGARGQLDLIRVWRLRLAGTSSGVRVVLDRFARALYNSDTSDVYEEGEDAIEAAGYQVPNSLR